MSKFRAACCVFRVDRLFAPRLFGNKVSFFGGLLALLLCGCCTPDEPAFQRPFVFQGDTFAFANELVWSYSMDPATGKTTHTRTQPPPAYTLHCFVVARAARQFFQHAQFDPSRPVADEATYRRLIRRVVFASPRGESSEEIVIPGYANLRAFSEAQEQLLKEECGGAWQSYFQRGHWRMIFPMSHRHQAKMAEQLAESLSRNRPPVVHVFCFPSLSINHAVVVFGVRKNEEEMQFDVYDPNQPERPAQLTFDRTARRFNFPANRYFAGGPVNVYEIYCGWNY